MKTHMKIVIAFLVIASGFDCYYAKSTRKEKAEMLEPLDDLVEPLAEIEERYMLTGGPTNPYPRALAVQSVPPVISVFEKRIYELLDEVRKGLRYLFQTKNKWTLAITGTGHMGMQTVLMNLLEPNDIVLIPICGMWGNRVSDLARRIGATVKNIEKPVGHAFTLADFKKAVKIHKPDVLYIIHGESSTGAVQCLQGLGDLCRKHGCLLVVDTVGTIGNTPFYADKWKVDAAFCNTQKSVGSIAGFSPVTFGPRAVAKIKNRATPVLSFISDMPSLAVYWGCDKGLREYHHTIPILPLLGLREALAHIIEETLEKSWERHATAVHRAYELIEELNLEHFVPNPEERLLSAITLKIPKGVRNVTDILGYAKEKYHVDMGVGLGPTLFKIIRIGLMGPNADLAVVEKAFHALKKGIEHAKRINQEI